MPAAVDKAAQYAQYAHYAQYAQVDRLLLERNSQRSIGCVTGVARMTVAGRIKKALSNPPPLPRLRPKRAQRQRWEALELEEMWTFVGRKKRKVWLWLAVERASRRIVARVLGQRDGATARRLWQALPRRYHRHCWSFTDRWKSYVGALPRWQHRRCPKGSGGPSIVEAVTCSLRQRCGVLVRKSCSFSKSLEMHQARSKIVINRHNIILN